MDSILLNTRLNAIINGDTTLTDEEACDTIIDAMYHDDDAIIMNALLALRKCQCNYEMYYDRLFLLCIHVNKNIASVAVVHASNVCSEKDVSKFNKIIENILLNNSGGTLVHAAIDAYFFVNDSALTKSILNVHAIVPGLDYDMREYFLSLLNS